VSWSIQFNTPFLARAILSPDMDALLSTTNQQLMMFGFAAIPSDLFAATAAIFARKYFYMMAFFYKEIKKKIIFF
jgi:hypothetical protein